VVTAGGTGVGTRGGTGVAVETGVGVGGGSGGLGVLGGLGVGVGVAAWKQLPGHEAVPMKDLPTVWIDMEVSRTMMALIWISVPAVTVFQASAT
jgi:hypothetical protein